MPIYHIPAFYSFYIKVFTHAKLEMQVLHVLSRLHTNYGGPARADSICDFFYAQYILLP